MTTVPQQFDAVAYKRTTTDQWDSAADRWRAWGPTIEEWLAPATDVMLDPLRRDPRFAQFLKALNAA